MTVFSVRATFSNADDTVDSANVSTGTVLSAGRDATRWAIVGITMENQTLAVRRGVGTGIAAFHRRSKAVMWPAGMVWWLSE